MTNTRGDRLKLARSRFFASARAAARAMDIPPATYGAHERAEHPGGRDFSAGDALRYARRFRVTGEWLLLGTGTPPGAEHVPEAEIGSNLASLARLLESAAVLAEGQITILGKIRSAAPRTMRKVWSKSKVEKRGNDKSNEDIAAFAKLDRAFHRLETARLASERLIVELRGLLNAPKSRDRS
jgi:hypothetical protein